MKFLILDQYGRQIESEISADDITSGTLNANRLPAYQNQTTFVKDNVVVTNWLFQDGQIQCYANNGGIPAFGLHSGNKEAIAIYYLDNQLRSKRNTDQDYLIAECESGTWTPTVSGIGGGSATFASRSGNWRRVGNIVFCDFSFQIAQNPPSLSGYAVLGGLPFASRSANGKAQIAQVQGASFPANTRYIYLAFAASSSSASFNYFDGSTSTVLPGSAISSLSSFSGSFNLLI